MRDDPGARPLYLDALTEPKIGIVGKVLVTIAIIIVVGVTEAALLVGRILDRMAP